MLLLLPSSQYSQRVMYWNTLLPCCLKLVIGKCRVCPDWNPWALLSDPIDFFFLQTNLKVFSSFISSSSWFLGKKQHITGILERGGELNAHNKQSIIRQGQKSSKGSSNYDSTAAPDFYCYSRSMIEKCLYARATRQLQPPRSIKSLRKYSMDRNVDKILCLLPVKCDKNLHGKCQKMCIFS